MKINLFYLLISALISSVNSRMFYYIPDKMNWTDAQSYCRQHYIDLATIDNRTEMNVVLNILPKATNPGAWIGLYRTDASAPWIWSDRSTSTFRPWQSGQPNNAGNNQYCVHLTLSGVWNDWECPDLLAFVCYSEKKRETVRLEVKSSQNVNDPGIKGNILAKVEQLLKAKGLPADAVLSWKTLSGQNVFNKMWYQKSDVSIAACRNN